MKNCITTWLLRSICVHMYACSFVLCFIGCTQPPSDKIGNNTMQPSITLTGHRDYISSLVFLNREQLATASFDKSIKIWDIGTGKELYSLDEHKEQINDLALSADGKRLFSGASAEGVLCWEKPGAVSSKFYLQRRICNWKSVRALAFLSVTNTLAIGEDSRTLVNGNIHGKGSVHLYNPNNSANETVIRMKPGSLIKSLAVSPDNKLLVVTTSDNTILFYNLVARKTERSVVGHVTKGGEGIFCVVFSPDGQKIATGGLDRSVRVWEVKSGRELFALIGHSQIVKSVSISPDGKLLASGGGEGYREAGELKIWDLSSRNELIGLAAHNKPIRVVAFSPDGKLLATGSEDQTVKIWSTTDLIKK